MRCRPAIRPGVRAASVDAASRGTVDCPLRCNGKLLQLRILQADVAGLAFDVLIALREVAFLLSDALEHLLGQRRDGLGRQTL